MPFKLRLGLSRHHSSPARLAPPTPVNINNTLNNDLKRFCKRLEEITAKEESQRGISPRVFQTRVFPAYPELAERLLRSLRRTGGSTVAPLTADELVEGAEKLMTILSDERQTEMYLRMYAEGEADLSKTAFQQLVALAHAVALDHYPDGPRCCRKTDHTLHALANAAFHGKESLSVGYLTHWIAENCPRLLLGLHRYVVHHLNTSYRTLDSPLGTLPQNEEEMDLGTPVLENKGFAFATSAAEEREAGALPLSQVWLLAVSLPKVYTQPSVIHSPSAGSGLASLDSQGIIARWLGSVCPSHWTPLYNSDVHGLGANRFLNHVLNYRGPTLTLVRGEGGVEFCVGATDEWRETHLYWGAQDCIVLQTQPLFHVIERGAKLVYLNTSIRGYPLGVRAGCDPRKPSLSVNEAFTQLEYKGIPYPLLSVEVWGCGTSHSREAQLELKKWQVKQAERQRQVKLSAADWVDHPDRYLLELGGRTTYNDP
ncbi:uncharacterized protein LOC132196206 isoform X2 [Neocloeon triangulifer]|uniref:uncharacterized protein LOC132196206 isoform X2 n=1 Tax=Neocloeon triangulifer TaxID=2078957 RepID=UPI00286ED28C|nr:uncharacterized protein LOC132196206 isoform X2 [Neocloeon triangulifer]